jgi:hypothetical protein
MPFGERTFSFVFDAGPFSSAFRQRGGTDR